MWLEANAMFLELRFQAVLRQVFRLIHFERAVQTSILWD